MIKDIVDHKKVGQSDLSIVIHTIGDVLTTIMAQLQTYRHLKMKTPLHFTSINCRNHQNKRTYRVHSYTYF